MRHDHEVAAVAFSSDGKLALTGSQDRTAQLWNAETGAAVGERMFHAREVWVTTFSPDGQQVLVGTSDSLIDLDRALYDQMSKAGKPVRMEIYADGYHDFVMGPQGHPGRQEPLLDATLDALERSLKFVRDP